MKKDKIFFDNSTLLKLKQPNLYRFFSKIEYAKSFFSGSIRLSKIKKYTEIEDIRADKAEGNAEFLEESDRILSIPIGNDGKPGKPYYRNGIINSGVLLGNQYYILCCSEAKTEEQILFMRKRFSDKNEDQRVYPTV